jgi:hypothetical protein
MPSLTFANSCCVFFRFSCCSCRCFLTSSIFSMERLESDTSVARMDSICFAESLDWSASEEISLATTAKPLPASPARAASMEALSARRFVWFFQNNFHTIPPLIISSYQLQTEAMPSDVLS